MPTFRVLHIEQRANPIGRAAERNNNKKMRPVYRRRFSCKPGYHKNIEKDKGQNVGTACEASILLMLDK